MAHLGAVPKTNGYPTGSSGEHQPIRSEAPLIGSYGCVAEPCAPDEGLLSEQRL